MKMKNQNELNENFNKALIELYVKSVDLIIKNDAIPVSSLRNEEVINGIAEGALKQVVDVLAKKGKNSIAYAIAKEIYSCKRNEISAFALLTLGIVQQKLKAA